MARVPSRRFLAVGAGLALLLMTVGTAAASPGAPRQVFMPVRGSNPFGGASSSNLYYHGGNVEVKTAHVFVVFWGSQWNGNDPSGEASIVQSFLKGVGGSSWDKSVTQYCQGVASGTYFCGTAGTAVDGGIAFGNYWYDNGSAAPNKPRQSQLAAEAAKAAGHFSGFNSATDQIVVATAHGYNAQGFGSQYCAWHSSTSSSGSTIGYTNLPYITDAGASCGANFNGLGPNAGITIVEGHELAETQTDIYPNGGWLDSGGAENGDKCAWNSATANVSFTTGTYPVQPLWSNAANNSTGGCVLSYP